MESGERPRGRKLTAVALSLSVTGLVLFALWWTWGPGVGWRYMAPYRSLVARRATEQEVTAEIGKPYQVIKTKAEFHGWLRDFGRADTARIWSHGHIFVYYADPWHDQDGFVVYLAFDDKGRATRTQLVGHAKR